MKIRLFLSAALVAVVAPVLAIAAAAPASAAPCAARTYNLYNPLTGERLVAADVDVYTSPLGNVVLNPHACITGVTGYTGTATGANVPALVVGSVGQICYVPSVGCVFNYGAGADVNGSPDLTPVNTSTAGGPVCVGSICPSAAVNSGFSVAVGTGNFSAAVVQVPVIVINEPICVRYGSGAVC